MDYKKSCKIYNICLYSSLALLLIALMIDVNWLGVVGIVLFVAGIIQAGIFYRCPQCGRTFNLKGRRPKYCPDCGHELKG